MSSDIFVFNNRILKPCNLGDIFSYGTNLDIGCWVRDLISLLKLQVGLDLGFHFVAQSHA